MLRLAKPLRPAPGPRRCARPWNGKEGEIRIRIPLPWGEGAAMTVRGRPSARGGCANHSSFPRSSRGKLRRQPPRHSRASGNPYSALRRNLDVRPPHNPPWLWYGRFMRKPFRTRPALFVSAAEPHHRAAVAVDPCVADGSSGLPASIVPGLLPGVCTGLRMSGHRSARIETCRSGGSAAPGRAAGFRTRRCRAGSGPALRGMTCGGCFPAGRTDGWGSGAS